MNSKPTPDPARLGVALSGGAYLMWGFLPLYYRELDHVSVLDVLAHRGLWALAFVALIVTILRRWPLVWAAVSDRRSLGILAVTGVLIASNWGGFIYAVANDLVLDASLGYFINPLMSV
ncbi:MAG: EamA family transporter RarD, partial [Pseudomonadota bacterium]